MQPKTDLSKSVLGFELLDVLEKIKSCYHRYKISSRVSTDESLRDFLSLNEVRQQAILGKLKNNLDLLVYIINDGSGFFEKNSIYQEKRHLYSALNLFDLELVDDDESYIVEGDTIEIYDDGKVQVYRNFEFIKQCSYDLLTLSIYEWHELYDRPSLATKKIFDVVGNLLQNDDWKVVKYEISEHTLCEIKITPPRYFSVRPKYLVPLKCKLSGRKRGVIHTSSSKLLLDSDQSDNFHHI